MLLVSRLVVRYFSLIGDLLVAANMCVATSTCRSSSLLLLGWRWSDIYTRGKVVDGSVPLYKDFVSLITCFFFGYVGLPPFHISYHRNGFI